MPSSPQIISRTATPTLTVGHVFAFTSNHIAAKMSPPVQHQYLVVEFNQAHPFCRREKWADPDERHTYMETSIEHGIAWQIRTNRTRRSMSQKQLAAAIGTAQSGVARIEDVEYGKHSIDLLVKVANAFDCALLVKFVPYSRLAVENEDLSSDALYARSYSEDATLLLSGKKHVKIKE